MEADAFVEVVRVAGRDVVRQLRSAPPLTLRATIDGVRLVGSGAGPLGGDRLRLGVRVGEDARLHLGSVAATMAQPGPHGGPSHLTTAVEVATGGALRVGPQPTVLVRGCDHHATTTISVARGAAVAWRDEVVLGRHDETGGSVRQRLDVHLDGDPLLRTEVRLGERWPGSLGPAGVDGARAVGSLLLVGDTFDLAGVEAEAELADLAHPPRGPGDQGVGADRAGGATPGYRVGAFRLGGASVLVSVVGERPSMVTAVLDHLEQVAAGAGQRAATRW